MGRAPDLLQRLSSPPDAYTCAGQIVAEYVSLPGQRGCENRPGLRIAYHKPRTFLALAPRRYASRSEEGAFPRFVPLSPQEFALHMYDGRIFPEETELRLAAAA